MVDVSKLSKYLKAGDVVDGDVINFVDGGVILEKDFKKKDGSSERNPVLEITVEVNGNKKTYSPNGTTRKVLTEKWGKDTDEWIGKKARITIVPSPNGGDMIIAKPID